MAELQPPVCLITGGARGIGAATSREASRLGYAVCVNYLTSEAEAGALVAAIKRGGGNAVAVRADVSRESDVARLFKELDRALGPPAVVVNNAGLSTGRRPLADTDLAQIQRVIDVNLIGSLLCIKEAIGRMAKSCGGKGGSIVNLSSTVTRTGGYRLAPYVAAKAGVEGLTKALAPELAAEGIRINALRPGIIATDRVTRENGNASERAATIPMGRPGTPDEVARAVLWVASDSASYITGAVLDVSGGR